MTSASICSPPRSQWTCVGGELGRGAYGHVMQVSHSPSSQTCARKTFFGNWNKTNVHASYAVAEYQIGKYLQHPCLLPLLDVHLTKSQSLSFFTPLMNTTLARLLTSQQDITIRHVAYWMYQLLCGLQYMHSAGVVHRDIKPDNLLINVDDCELRIADFGKRGRLAAHGCVVSLLARCSLPLSPICFAEGLRRLAFYALSPFTSI
jgi:serine/threonine protein kinase